MSEPKTAFNPQTLATLPSRPEVESKLLDLIEGRCTPEAASDWASQWIMADLRHGVDVEVNDHGVWDALGSLMGADSITTDRPYLFGESDFRAWLDELHRTPKYPQ